MQNSKKKRIEWLAWTAVMLMPCLNSAHAQGKPFASRKAFLNERPSHVEEALKLRDPDPTDSVERVLKEENALLDKVSGFTTPLHIGEGGTCAHPDVGIVVDKSDLDDIFQQNTITRSREILRFVLAHEKAHMVQFRRWPESKKDTGNETSRLYEAHADILAGKFVEEMMYPKVEADVPTEVMDVAFGLSENRFAHGTHPSKQERRDSVRLGLASGIILNMERLAAEYNQIAPRQSAAILRQKLNVQQSDDVMEWALRTAKRNIGYTSDAVSEISLARLNDNSIHWNTNPATPVVDYRLVYRNTGDAEVRVDLEVDCMSVSRAAPKDKTQWQKWSCQFYRFTLAPGAEHQVNGQLQWYGDREVMPSLKYGVADAGLVSAEFTDPSHHRQPEGGDSSLLHDVVEALSSGLGKYKGSETDRDETYINYVSRAPKLRIDDLVFKSEIDEDRMDHLLAQNYTVDRKDLSADEALAQYRHILSYAKQAFPTGWRESEPSQAGSTTFWSSLVRVEAGWISVSGHYSSRSHSGTFAVRIHQRSN